VCPVDSIIKNFDDYLDLKNTDIETVIHELWVSKDYSLWSSEPYFYIRLGETADKLGQSMFAHDILQEGLEYFPENLRLTQLYALSLIKCGFIYKARAILTNLVRKGHFDEETLGILGRVYKDMWVLSGGSSGDATFLHKSRNFYLQAFKKSRGYYSGINAASLSFMAGERRMAEKLALIVLKTCSDLLKDPEKRDYWVLATVGEGLLLLGKKEEAKKYFLLAKKCSVKNYSYLASTKKQMRLLSNYIDIGPDIFTALQIPSVVAFTGHMIDHPDRKTSRFPPGLEEDVEKEIVKRLEKLHAGIGYSSAACGSDILFLECMQDRKAETNIILPFELEDFYATSIHFAGQGWVERAKKVLKKSSQTLQATEGKYAGDDLLFEYANQIVMGKAILRSELLETETVLLAVWDGKKATGAGGTSEFIRTWESKNLQIEIIDINSLRKSYEKDRQPAVVQSKELSSPAGYEEKKDAKKIKRAVKAMLFADLVGFSTLKEEQIPYFIQNYLGTVAGSLKQSRYKPLFKNTWGDALYFVFDDLISAAEYALELRDLIKKMNWEKSNLPGNLNIRIGLHAGPVFYTKEPILKTVNYFGTHVNRAARIEPITNPGNVYASEQFAALLMAHKENALECEYVGIIVLPKKFGKYPIYHIKRRNEIE